MKNLKDIISEKLFINQNFNINEKLIINKNTKVQNIYSKFPELEKLKFNIDVDSLIQEIKEYFIDTDAYNEKQQKQLDEFEHIIPRNILFAKVDEDTGWDINDYIREEDVEYCVKVTGDELNPIAAIYNIKDDLIVQLVDDVTQELFTYVSDTNI